MLSALVIQDAASLDSTILSREIYLLRLLLVTVEWVRSRMAEKVTGSQTREEQEKERKQEANGEPEYEEGRA